MFLYIGAVSCFGGGLFTWDLLTILSSSVGTYSRGMLIGGVTVSVLISLSITVCPVTLLQCLILAQCECEFDTPDLHVLRSATW